MDMKKRVIKLNESDLEELVKKILKEGKIDKSTREKDLDVKMENFREKIKDFLKSKNCTVKQVGTDFEIHRDGEHVAQVMFRRNAITVKKEGSKFGKDFNFKELGKIKSELNKVCGGKINEGGDSHRSSRYMFFSNLEQMHRQTTMLMDMDQNTLEQILENGHDWAQDHIAEAKNNMDQVFDFIMNEIKEPSNIHNNMMEEKWSKKYKNNIDCNNPKGFSQKAYCSGRKKRG
jgi:division protein CdvB (Snf7/Vps24/ESCRT-III family)